MTLGILLAEAHDTLDEVEVLWNGVFTVVHGEHSVQIQFNVVPLLSALEQIE